MNICIHVEYRIFVANYITSHDNRTVSYKKHLLCWHQSVLNYWHWCQQIWLIQLAFQVAFSIGRGRKDGWNDMRRNVEEEFPYFLKRKINTWSWLVTAASDTSFGISFSRKFMAMSSSKKFQKWSIDFLHGFRDLRCITVYYWYH